MKKYLLLIITSQFIYPFTHALTLSPTPFPVFLRPGFSTVLEFEESPTRVVLGDVQNFQVEKLDRSIVAKTNASYATSNMFVYFKTNEPRLFVLTASEDVDPTYYKKFESIVPKKIIGLNKTILQRGISLVSAKFSPKKDFLTIEVLISADSTARILPQWQNVRLNYKYGSLSASKLWSERQEVQKDSGVKARFVFAKPNLSKKLAGASLSVPIAGSIKPFTLNLAGRSL